MQRILAAGGYITMFANTRRLGWSLFIAGIVLTQIAEAQQATGLPPFGSSTQARSMWSIMRIST